MHADMSPADDRNEGNVLPLLGCKTRRGGGFQPLKEVLRSDANVVTRFLVRNLDTGVSAKMWQLA